ncbi:HEAT repeat domain-containing protein [Cellulophaga baltica]|uniref:HEAT repeat domain-containing protein n=1 Tax=Cellulophaga baltica TaxID=76594 RepID=UPI002494B705|nr:HEAT repeat domain-containing protein [Cellulophaga baltica]
MKFPQLKIFHLLSAPKIHTDILWDLSALFVILSVLYFVAIFFFRSKFLKKSADTNRRKNILAPLVSEFLFYQEEEGSKEEKKSYIQKKVEIRELIKDPINEMVLTEILLDLKKDVSGDTRKQLFKLYKDLNLELRAFEKLKSWKWQKISQAMFELTQMQVAESYDFISGFINDKRSVIRKQAEISSVTLDKDGLSYFLDTTTYQISEWQQLKILEVLSNYDDFEAPRFYRWLTSKNKHVVLFALRLIKHYDQNDSRGSIVTLIRHKNNSIKLEAINCIKQFYIVEAKPTLKAAFWRNKANVKLAILDTLAEFGDKEEILFLLDVANKESNFTVKSKALSAINSIQPEYIIPTEDIELFDEDAEEPPLNFNTPTELTADKENLPEEIQEVSEDTLPQVDIIDRMYAAMVEFVPKEIPINEQLVDQEISGVEVEQLLQEEATLGSIADLPFEEEIDAAINDTDNEISVFSEEEQYEVCNSTEELSASYQSIFKSLFEKSDDDCKLLLLDEMLTLADEKDLPFLNSLTNYPNPIIKDKVAFIKKGLHERLEKPQPAEGIEDSVIEVLNEISENSYFDESQMIDDVIKKESICALKPRVAKSLKSMELCFLEDDIGANSLDLFDINFQIDATTDEFKSSVRSTETALTTEHEQALTKEEHGFFQKFLDFPTTLTDKLNG